LLQAMRTYLDIAKQAVDVLYRTYGWGRLLRPPVTDPRNLLDYVTAVRCYKVGLTHFITCLLFCTLGVDVSNPACPTAPLQQATQRMLCMLCTQ
jgi:hypothetical protein